jgi:hypothetical protein
LWTKEYLNKLTLRPTNQIRSIEVGDPSLTRKLLLSSGYWEEDHSRKK